MKREDRIWEVPQPNSTCQVALDDGTVTVLRRYGNVDGRRLILSHGNGLAIDFYYPFWSLLLDEFDLVLYDIRNHGRNELGPISQHNVPVFIADLHRVLAAMDQQFGAKPRIGVFHSLSALIALLSLSSIMTEQVSAEGPSFSQLVLFDPPLFLPTSESVFEEVAEGLIRRTRKRSNRFRSLEDFAELLSYSPNFSRMVPGAHRLMAATTLRRSAEGEHFVLRCPPEYEARVLEYARSYGGLVDLGDLPCPTKVIGADPTLPFAYLPTFDLELMGATEYDFLPDATHYLQLEKPDECVAALREYLGQGPS